MDSGQEYFMNLEMSHIHLIEHTVNNVAIEKDLTYLEQQRKATQLCHPSTTLKN